MMMPVTRHRLWLLRSLGRPYPIDISSKHEGEHSTHYYVTWNRPHTGGRPITKYEFKLLKVSLLCYNYNRQQSLLTNVVL